MRRLLLVVGASATLAITTSAASGREHDTAGLTGRIAYSYRYFPEDNRILDNHEIFVLDLVGGNDNGNLTRFAQCGEVDPAWSHSGRWIAFACQYGPSVGIFILRDDRTERRRLVRTAPYKSGDPAWSPNDRTLAFKRARGIWSVDVDGGRLRQLTGRGDASPTWSADGQVIAFDRTVREAPRIVRMRANGAGQRTIALNACCPVWSPDGRSIAFIRRNWVWTMNGDGRGQRRLPGRTTGDLTDLAWSPDSRYLAYYVYCCRESGIYVMAADGTGRRRLSFGPEFQGIDWGRDT